MNIITKTVENLGLNSFEKREKNSLQTKITKDGGR